MAAKRINKSAPLTAAEKQKRYREKQAAEDKKEDDRILKNMREVLIEDINKLSLEELRALIKKIYSPAGMDRLVSLEELSRDTGISLHELKKLEAQGVIEPVKDNGFPENFCPEFFGLTEDEFFLFVQQLDDEGQTYEQISKKTGIPMYKLNRVKRLLNGKDAA